MHSSLWNAREEPAHTLVYARFQKLPKFMCSNAFTSKRHQASVSFVPLLAGCSLEWKSWHFWRHYRRYVMRWPQVGSLASAVTDLHSLLLGIYRLDVGVSVGSPNYYNL